MSKTPKAAQAPIVDPVELARRVKAKRKAEKLNLRDAGTQVGMSAATLSRVESGSHLPERDRLFRLAEWAGMPLGRAARASRNQGVHRERAHTVEAIELHLRADKKLDPDDAETLVELVRTAYDRMSQRK
jgi:transcriptional regulator with XRE-family HTH domain